MFSARWPQVDAARCNNITWERLEREGAVTYPVDGTDQPGNDIIFAAGFPTQSGRGKIVPADHRAAGRASR